MQTKQSRCFIVSRHPATVRWLNLNLPCVHGVFAELPLHELQSGDKVYGNLSAHLIAELCAIKCEYFHVVIKLPYALRGQELNDAALAHLNPTLAQIEAHIIP